MFNALYSKYVNGINIINVLYEEKQCKKFTTTKLRQRRD